VNLDQKTLFEYFNEKMAKPNEIVKAGISRTLGKNEGNIEYIKKNFSELVLHSEKNAYDIFLEIQKASWSHAINRYFTPTMDQLDTEKQKADFLMNNFEDLDSFFLSLSQSRKSRGGSSFQYIIKDMLSRLDYPFSEEPVINGKPDFLFPSEEHYRENPMDCIIFTVKRKIRERWRQIVTEGTRGLGFFLATIDEKVSQNQIQEMAANRIYLVVPASIKQKVEHYGDASNVISFETFFLDYLDPGLQRWKRAHLV